MVIYQLGAGEKDLCFESLHRHTLHREKIRRAASVSRALGNGEKKQAIRQVPRGIRGKGKSWKSQLDVNVRSGYSDHYMDIQQALTILKTFYIHNKRLPSYGEMGKLFGYASKNASYQLTEKLIKADIVAKDTAGKLIPKQLFTIPHIGGTPKANGEQLYMTQNTFDFYAFVTTLPQNVFSLTMTGDAMIGEGIFEGDVVIVNCDREAENGEIVAACVDGIWIVRYYFKQGKAVVLRPANESHLPTYPKKSFEIGGVVIRVIRRYV